MAEVEVRIGERDVVLSCDDGQEARLRTLAEDFDRRLSDVHATHGTLGERQALIVAALAVLDEFDEARSRWADITPEGAAAEWAADRIDRANERLMRALKQNCAR